MLANRNGFFYVLDRIERGAAPREAVHRDHLGAEVDSRGRPIVLNDGSKGCLPDQWGGTNFNPPSFDPALGLFFINSRETCGLRHAGTEDGARTSEYGRRRPRRGRLEGVWRAARDRSGDRRAALGVQLHLADDGGSR